MKGGLSKVVVSGQSWSYRRGGLSQGWSPKGGTAVHVCIHLSVQSIAVCTLYIVGVTFETVRNLTDHNRVLSSG